MTIKGSDSLTAVVKRVNPAVAKEMLRKGHPRNRRISPARVNRYAQAMKLDEWIVAQPIMVNCDGTLIDGHHRLHAVIRSARTIDFVVLAGYDADGTFGRIDEVAERKLHHWLHMRGEPFPETLAAILLMSARWEAGQLPTQGGGRFQVTAVEGLEYLDRRPKLREAVLDAPGQTNRLLSRSLVCYGYYLFAAKNKADAKNFFIELVMGDSKGQYDPIFLLRERLKSNRNAKVKLSRTELLALTIKAWNAVRSKTKMRQLKWVTAGEKVEPFPEPI